MGVWLPDGWMENAPGGFPLTPLIPPGPPSLPAAGREGGKRVGFGGGGEAAAPKPPPFSPSPRRAAAVGRGLGGGVSPEGQVVSTPVYVLVNFLKFIILRYTHTRFRKQAFWGGSQKCRPQKAISCGG
jgi:hypothetical protein